MSVSGMGQAYTLPALCGKGGPTRSHVSHRSAPALRQRRHRSQAPCLRGDLQIDSLGHGGGVEDAKIAVCSASIEGASRPVGRFRACGTSRRGYHGFRFSETDTFRPTSARSAPRGSGARTQRRMRWRQIGGCRGSCRPAAGAPYPLAARRGAVSAPKDARCAVRALPAGGVKDEDSGAGPLPRDGSDRISRQRCIPDTSVNRAARRLLARNHN